MTGACGPHDPTAESHTDATDTGDGGGTIGVLTAGIPSKSSRDPRVTPRVVGPPTPNNNGEKMRNERRSPASNWIILEKTPQYNFIFPNAPRTPA